MKAFAGLHPLVLLFYFLSVLTVAMFVPNPVLSLLALLGAILFCATGTRRGAMARDLGFYLPMFLLVAITNPLFSHSGDTPLFFLNGKPITLEAFVYGVAIGVMIVGVMLWCKAYGAVMTSDKFLWLFARIIPKLALVLSMALRFLPMFCRRMKQVKIAQKTMGLYAGRGLMPRVRCTGRVFLAVIGWSLENAMETAASMQARGYGTGKRTDFSLFRFTARDGVLLAVCVGLMGVTVAGLIAGVTSFSYYPRIGRVNASPLSLAVYAAFGLLSLLPFALERWEAAVRRSCLSRIK